MLVNNQLNVLNFKKVWILINGLMLSFVIFLFLTFIHGRSLKLDCLTMKDLVRSRFKFSKKVLEYVTQVHVRDISLGLDIYILKRITGNLNSATYQNMIINNIDLVGKYMVFPMLNFIFQYDNAPCLRSASTISFLTERQLIL